MENYKLPIEEVQQKLIDAGLIVNNKPISFNKFKKLARVDQYVGYRTKVYAIYFSCGNHAWLGFYPPMTSKSESLEIAYEYLNDWRQNYVDTNIVWGNKGIPIGYRKISAYMPDVVKPISILEDELR
jgi:hypothetical protein